MSLTLKKRNVNVCRLVCQEKKRFTVEGEVSVPDIKPDMLNLVNVYADCFITGKEVLDNRVKVEGNVDTYLIYLADDEEGAVRSITYSFPFVEYVEAPGVVEGTKVSLKSQVVRSRSKSNS